MTSTVYPFDPSIPPLDSGEPTKKLSAEAFLDTPTQTPMMSAEDFLGPAQFYNGQRLHGPAWDQFFGKDTGPGGLIETFKKTFGDTFGPDPLGFDRMHLSAPPEEGKPDTRKSVTQHLKDIGFFSSISGPGSLIQDFNETLFRGTAALADYALRTPYALIRGLEATSRSDSAVGQYITGPIGAVGSALFEAFPAGHFTGAPARPVVAPLNPFHPAIVKDTLELAHKDTPHWTADKAVDALRADQGPTPSANRIVLDEAPKTVSPEDLYRSGLEAERASKVRALNELDPVTQKAERDALQTQLSELHKSITELPARDASTSDTPIMRPPASVEIDALMEQRTELQRWRSDLQTEPRTFDIGGVEIPATTRLFEADRALTEAEQRQTGDVAVRAGQAQQVGEAITTIDKRIVELAPAAAEERAARGPAMKYEFQPPRYEDIGLPPEGEVPLPDGITKNPIVDPAAPTAETGFTVDTPNGFIQAKDLTEAREVAAKYGVLSQRRPTIAQEVYRDLVGAGRPDREARAHAAILQAYYETKAARFEGKLGTAREIYDAEAPDIKAGRGRNRGAFNLIDNTIKLFRDADASTFMHESAHNFLEQMLVDAVHEHAPVGLVEDVAAIKQWLVMEGERPTRAQHELFARGFERYLMEGVAPSEKLQGVFAKISAWLSKLYNTVAALKAPITNDIRAVYDRLLSQPKTEAYIEPVRPGRAGFADEHEATARTTPPEMALIEAERLRAERDDIGSVLRTEIDAGIRRARASGRTAGAAGEGVGGGATVPKPTARRVPTGAKGAGAGEPAAEVGASGAAPAAERITRPDQPIGRSGSFHVDGTGHIILDSIQTEADVQQALRDSAQFNKNFGHEANARVSDGQLLDLANSLGADVAFLDRKLIGESFTAAEITAARLMIRQNEADILAAAKKAREGGGFQDLAIAVSRNSMIQGKLNQARAEWGRAGRALQDITAATTDEALAAFLKDNKGDFGRNYDQLTQMANYLGTLTGAGQVSKMARNTIGARFPMLYYYLNSLLSGPITHSIYALGNEMRAISQPLIVTPLQATVGSVRAGVAALAGRTVTDRVHWREVAADWYGFGKGQVEGWRAFKTAFASGSQITLPGLQGYASAMSQIGSTIDMPMGTGFRRIATGIGTGDLAETGRGIVQAYGLPYRSVAAIHSFGVMTRYMQNINRFAVRQALEEGLTGTALETRIAKLRAEPTDTMMAQAFDDKGNIMPDVPKELRDWADVAQRASQEAMESMYMRVYDYHSPAAQAVRGLHGNGFTAMMVPFIKVGLEIQRENFVRHTPIGFLASETRAELLGRKGGAAFDEAQGRLIFGMSLMSGGALLSSMGLMDDIGPYDPADRAVWKLNHQEHSLQIGSVRVPLKGIPVLGGLMMFGADMYAASHQNWWKPEYEQLAKNVLHGIASAAFDEGVFITLGDIGEVVHDPIGHAGKWLLNWIPNFMPWSIGMAQVNRFGIDPYSKDIHGFDPTALMDSFRKTIPGQSQYVPNRVDVYGNPIASRGSWIAHHNDYVNDPVTKMLDAVHMSVGQLERKIEGVDLTTREYEHYSVLAGRATYNILKPFTTANLGEQPAGVRRMMFHQVIEAARATARAQMLMESLKNDPNNSLSKKAYEKKLELFK